MCVLEMKGRPGGGEQPFNLGLDKLNCTSIPAAGIVNVVHQNFSFSFLFQPAFDAYCRVKCRCGRKERKKIEINIREKKNS